MLPFPLTEIGPRYSRYETRLGSAVSRSSAVARETWIMFGEPADSIREATLTLTARARAGQRSCE